LVGAGAPRVPVTRLEWSLAALACGLPAGALWPRRRPPAPPPGRRPLRPPPARRRAGGARPVLRAPVPAPGVVDRAQRPRRGPAPDSDRGGRGEGGGDRAAARAGRDDRAAAPGARARRRRQRRARLDAGRRDREAVIGPDRILAGIAVV